MSELNLEDLQVEARTFAAGQSLESATVGQGVTEVGASVGKVACCTYACCEEEEELQ